MAAGMANTVTLTFFVNPAAVTEIVAVSISVRDLTCPALETVTTVVSLDANVTGIPDSKMLSRSNTATLSFTLSFRVRATGSGETTRIVGTGPSVELLQETAPAAANSKPKHAPRTLIMRHPLEGCLND